MNKRFFPAGMCLVIAMIGFAPAAYAQADQPAQPAPPKRPVAACSAWSMSDDLHSNAVQPSLGCTSRRNLTKMVAQPSDLRAGRPLGPASGARESLGVSAYEQGKVKAFSTGQQMGSTIVMPNVGAGTAP